MNNPSWTEDETAYLARVAGKVPHGLIARTLRKSQRSIAQKAHAMGVSLTVKRSILERHYPGFIGTENKVKSRDKP